MTPFPKTGEHTAKNDRPAHTPQHPPQRPHNLPKNSHHHTPPHGTPSERTPHRPPHNKNRKTDHPTPPQKPNHPHHNKIIHNIRIKMRTPTSDTNQTKHPAQKQHNNIHREEYPAAETG